MKYGYANEHWTCSEHWKNICQYFQLGSQNNWDDLFAVPVFRYNCFSASAYLVSL